MRIPARSCAERINGTFFRRFPGLREQAAAAVGRHAALLDGEIVALDDSGDAQFYPPLYRSADPYFYAFDCLWPDGWDLRGLPLVERKRHLRTAVPPQQSRLLYLHHIDRRGIDTPPSSPRSVLIPGTGFADRVLDCWCYPKA